MKQPILRKSTTFALKPKDTETPKGVSQTVPDMAMSLKTILERHTRGLEIPTYKPQYSEDEIPDLKRLDLTDIDNLKEYNQAVIADKQKTLQKAKATKQKQASEQSAQPPKTTEQQVPNV